MHERYKHQTWQALIKSCCCAHAPKKKRKELYNNQINQFLPNKNSDE